MVINGYPIDILVGGFSQPLWKMMEFVSWDYEIANIWNNKIHVPNHQPAMINDDDIKQFQVS